MEITKGAISHTLPYLYKKSLIRKVQNESDDMDVILFLNDEGRKAFMAHEDYHRAIHRKLKGLLRGMPEEQFVFFTSLLEKSILFLRRIRKSKKSLKFNG